MELNLEALAITLLSAYLKRERTIAVKALEILIKHGADTKTALKILQDLSQLGEGEGGKDD